MWPNRSTANSAAAGSLWYQQVNQGTQQICATQGLTFAKQLQQRLQTQLAALSLNGTSLMTGPTVNGQPLYLGAGRRSRNSGQSLALTTNGTIDASTLVGAWILGQQGANTLSLPASWTQAIVADLTAMYSSSGSVNNPLSYPTMEALIFIGGSNPADPVTNQQVPADIVPFTFGQQPPDDGASFFAGQVTCWNATDAPPANLQQAAQQQGIAPAGVSATTTPAGGTTQQLVDVGGASPRNTKFWTEVAVAGAALVGGGLLWWELVKRTGRRRR